MRASLTERWFDGTLARRLAAPRQVGVSLFWLGQAGFLIETGGRRVVIDPYLSNSLGRKYGHTPFPHTRMMPAPVTVAELGDVDLVLCTHHHTDHMDPETLALLAARDPHLRFVVPAASLASARERVGVSDDRLIPIDAGDRIELLPGLQIHAVRAAHEALERDHAGRHRFLGYVVEAGGLRLFHSGDCVPFEGQCEEIAAAGIDLALLPVNGRSELLRRVGIAGNFTMAEAVVLCEACGIPAMIAHHYGMFAFNTVDPASIDAASMKASFQLVRARTQVEYGLRLE